MDGIAFAHQGVERLSEPGAVATLEDLGVDLGRDLRVGVADLRLYVRHFGTGGQEQADVRAPQRA
jgi:hypothetical protein